MYAIGNFDNMRECRKLECFDVSPDNTSFCSVDGVLYDEYMECFRWLHQSD